MWVSYDAETILFVAHVQQQNSGHELVLGHEC